MIRVGDQVKITTKSGMSSTATVKKVYGNMDGAYDLEVKNLMNGTFEYCWVRLIDGDKIEVIQ